MQMGCISYQKEIVHKNRVISTDGTYRGTWISLTECCSVSLMEIDGEKMNKPQNDQVLSIIFKWLSQVWCSEFHQHKASYWEWRSLYQCDICLWTLTAVVSLVFTTSMDDSFIWPIQLKISNFLHCQINKARLKHDLSSWLWSCAAWNSFLIDQKNWMSPLTLTKRPSRAQVPLFSFQFDLRVLSPTFLPPLESPAAATSWVPEVRRRPLLFSLAFGCSLLRGHCLNSASVRWTSSPRDAWLL